MRITVRKNRMNQKKNGTRLFDPFPHVSFHRSEEIVPQGAAPAKVSSGSFFQLYKIVVSLLNRRPGRNNERRREVWPN